jgi:hypothetical protein
MATKLDNDAWRAMGVLGMLALAEPGPLPGPVK